MVPPSTPVTVAPEAAPLVMVPPGTGSYGRWPSPVPRIFSGKMCTSTAFWVPSGCGSAALPRKVPSLMSAIDAFTTATMLALSASAIFSCAPWAVFTVRTLPSTFSIVPLTRWVCAAALAHRAAISAPASAPRMVLVMAPSLGWMSYKYISPEHPPAVDARLAAGGFPRKRVGLAGFGGPAVVDRHEYRALEPQHQQVRGAPARRAPVVQVGAHEGDARGIVEQPFVRLRTLGTVLETFPEARLELLQLARRRRQPQDAEDVRRVDARRPFLLAVDHAHAVALEGAVAAVPAAVGEPPPPVRHVVQRQVQEAPRQQEPSERHEQQPGDAQVRRRQEVDHHRKVGGGEERAPAPAAAVGAVNVADAR